MASFWERHDALVVSVGGEIPPARTPAKPAPTPAAPDFKRRRTDSQTSPVLSSPVLGETSSFGHQHNAPAHTTDETALARPGTPPPPRSAKRARRQPNGGGGGRKSEGGPATLGGTNTNTTIPTTPTTPRRPHAPLYRHRYAAVDADRDEALLGSGGAHDTGASALVGAEVLVIVSSTWVEGSLVEASVVAVDLETSTVLHTSEITTRGVPCKLGHPSPESKDVPGSPSSPSFSPPPFAAFPAGGGGSGAGSAATARASVGAGAGAGANASANAAGDDCGGMDATTTKLGGTMVQQLVAELVHVGDTVGLLKQSSESFCVAVRTELCRHHVGCVVGWFQQECYSL